MDLLRLRRLHEVFVIIFLIALRKLSSLILGLHALRFLEHLVSGHVEGLLRQPVGPEAQEHLGGAAFINGLGK